MNNSNNNTNRENSKNITIYTIKNFKRSIKNNINSNIIVNIKDSKNYNNIKNSNNSKIITNIKNSFITQQFVINFQQVILDYYIKIMKNWNNYIKIIIDAMKLPSD